MGLQHARRGSSDGYFAARFVRGAQSQNVMVQATPVAYEGGEDAEVDEQVPKSLSIAMTDPCRSGIDQRAQSHQPRDTPVTVIHC